MWSPIDCYTRDNERRARVFLIAATLERELQIVAS